MEKIEKLNIQNICTIAPPLPRAKIIKDASISSLPSLSTSKESVERFTSKPSVHYLSEWVERAMNPGKTFRQL